MGNQQAGNTFDPDVWAAASTNVDKLREALRSHGHLIDTPNPKQFNRTPMHQAASAGSAAAIELLVESGSKAIDALDEDQQTPMHLAAESGHSEVIKALVRLGSKAIDARTKYEETPMHLAAASDHSEVIETLVRLGSTAIQSSTGPNSPMSTAARHGSASAIETLARLGCPLDVTLENGKTLMHAAAASCNGDAAIETLYRLGCRSIDASDKTGCMPLHDACRFSKLQNIEMLVRLGSQAINTRNRGWGWEPIRFAMDSYSVECGQVLKALGARTDITYENMDKGGLYVLHAPIDEDFVLDVRQRVYFDHSLARRLFLELLNGHHIA